MTAIKGSEMYKITIAIPTFNRPKQLETTLRAIAMQYREEFFLRIFDNSSSIPAAEILAKIGGPLESNSQTIRHQFNIGGNANVCRCFEICDTEYLWIIGDDDTISPTALNCIIDTIERIDADYFNFYSPASIHKVRRDEIIGKGGKIFVEEMDLGNCLFLPNSIYKIAKFKSELSFANHYSFTGAPQVILAVRSIINQSLNWAILKDTIVRNGQDFDEPTPTPSIVVVQSICNILSAIPGYPEKKLLRKKLSALSKNWLTAKGVVNRIVFDSNNYLSFESFWEYFELCLLYPIRTRSILLSCKWLMLSPLCLFPLISRRIIDALGWIMKKRRIKEWSGERL